MLSVLAYLLGFTSVVMAGMTAFPMLTERINSVLHSRVQDASVKLEDMFVNVSQHRLKVMHAITPVLLGGILWTLTGFWWAGVAGAVVGIIVPRFVLQRAKAQREGAFHGQLVDSLLLISSCLRAGLSMNQSLSVVAEEMPPPVSQEFGLLVKEMRMGVNLQDALDHLMKRMPSDELHMFISTVLVARDTGGDVTAIFAKLAETLRERKKIREKIKTLTFMARLQGILMALLPFAFFAITASTNQNQVTFFMQDPQGRVLGMGVILLQIMSACLFIRFSRSPL